MTSGTGTCTVTFNQAGNTAYLPAPTVTQSVTALADDTPPDTTITSAAANPTSSTSATFSFTSTEPTGATFLCSLDNADYTICTSGISYSGLLPGSHIFRVSAVDAAGNVDQSPASHNWTINAPDTTPPETTIASKPSSVTNKTNATFTFASSEAGSTFVCSLDGGTFTACISPQNYTGLANGNHSFQVQASDSAGNPDQSPASYNWTIDNSLITVLQGTITDRSTGLPIVGASVTIYGQGNATVNTDSNGAYSFTGQQYPFTGSVTLGVTARGYFASMTSVNIVAPFPVTVDKSLLPGGIILGGTVTDAGTNQPIASVGVCYSGGLNFYDLDGFSGGSIRRCATTDLSGNYSLDSSVLVEAAATAGATGQFTASAAGYLNLTQNGLHIAPPYPVTQNIALTWTGLTTQTTVATVPAGLVITVDNVNYISPQTFIWIPGSVHTIATTSPQGTSGTQIVFNNWSDNGAISHTLAAPSTNSTLTANFTTQYQLSTSASPSSGGSVTAGGLFNPGASVVITATPAAGFHFTGFTGDLSGTTNPQTVVMNGPRNVTATFALIVFPDTTITSAPPSQTNSSNASFSFSSTEVPSTFECSLDGSAFASCLSPASYGPLADGNHTFQSARRINSETLIQHRRVTLGRSRQGISLRLKQPSAGVRRR